jgi:ArsR family transcriptional regulator
MRAKPMARECCDLFKALSVDTRLRIIELLKSKGPLGAKKISELIGVTPSAVSQHLRTLKHVGLVRSERKGYWIPYELDEEALEICRCELNEVCTCSCETEPAASEVRLDQRNLKSLEAYRQELEKRLEAVTKRIEEIKQQRR